MPAFPTNDFALTDPADQSKVLFFDCSAMTTNTYRTMKVPAFVGGNIIQTFAVLEANSQTFTSDVTFTGAVIFGGGVLNSTGVEFNDLTRLVRWDNGAGHTIDIAAPGSIGGDRVATLPDATGTLALTNLAQDWGALQTFRDGNIKLTGDGDTSKRVQFDCDDVTASTTRTFRWPNVTAELAVVGDGADGPASGSIGRVNRTAQTADVSSTNLTNSTPAGLYLIHAILEDTTADVTAGVVTVTFAWTDDVGSTTDASLTLALTATGRARVSFPVYLASGNITYSTSHTGIFGTAQYALRVRCEFLG